MRCQDFYRHIDAYMTGELGEDTREQMEKHLSSCRDCRAALDDAYHIRAAFAAGDTPPVPEGFHESVMARAREENGVKERPGILDPFGHLSMLETPLRAAAVAAGVIVALGIGILVGRDLAEATAARQTQPVGREESDAVSSLGAEYLGEYPPESVSRAYANLTTTGGEQDR
ncbi:MAG: anti-sigma factor family protein [Candidatus Brocadiia bacterium]